MKNLQVPYKVFLGVESQLRDAITVALEKELADCMIPDLANDPETAGVWSSMPTVDSKTAHKISASLVEQLLGCEFHPKWIRRGGYTTVEDAVSDVLEQLRTHCVVPARMATAS